MKIVELKIKNMAGIEAFELTPKGEHVVIGGKNKAGKSTVLNMISGALGGKKNRPKVPVREGAKEGDVVVDLGDIVVRWRVPIGGTETLVVESKDGKKTYRSPQGMLTKLWGDRTFDPLGFFNADSEKQCEQLARLVGTDLDSFDKDIEILKKKRRDSGRDAKRARAAADVAETFKDTPEELVITAELAEELQRRHGYNRKTAGIESELDGAKRKANDLENELVTRGEMINGKAEQVKAECGISIDHEKERIQRFNDEQEKEVARLLEKIAEIKRVSAKTTILMTEDLDRLVENAKVMVDHAKSDAVTFRTKMAELQERNEAEIKEHKRSLDKREDLDESAIMEQIANADGVNAKVRANEHAATLKENAVELEKTHAEHSKSFDDKQAEKAAVIAAAPIPVDGLGRDEGAVTFYGRPLEQCSAAERIEISTALEIADHPEIKVTMIDKLQDLDEESRKIMMDMLEKAGIQLIATVVGTSDKDITVEIRDGNIV